MGLVLTVAVAKVQPLLVGMFGLAAATEPENLKENQPTVAKSQAASPTGWSWLQRVSVCVIPGFISQERIRESYNELWICSVSERHRLPTLSHSYVHSLTPAFTVEVDTFKKEVDVPSDQDVEQHGEEDDGHGGGDGDQDHLAALAGDGEGCWRAHRDQW